MSDRGRREVAQLRANGTRVRHGVRKFRDAQARSIFDAIIQIDETPRQLAGELPADGGFSGAMNPARATTEVGRVRATRKV